MRTDSEKNNTQINKYIDIIKNLKRVKMHIYIMKIIIYTSISECNENYKAWINTYI